MNTLILFCSDQCLKLKLIVSCQFYNYSTKLRSEQLHMSSHVSVKKSSKTLTPDCFSFCKKPIHKEPFELVRFTKKAPPKKTTSKPKEKKKSHKAANRVKLMDKELLEEIEFISSFAQRQTGQTNDDDDATSKESTPTKRAESPETMEHIAPAQGNDTPIDEGREEPDIPSPGNVLALKPVQLTEQDMQPEAASQPEAKTTKTTKPAQPMKIDFNFLKRKKKKKANKKVLKTSEVASGHQSIFNERPVTGKRKRSIPARLRDYESQPTSDKFAFDDSPASEMDDEEETISG